MNKKIIERKIPNGKLLCVTAENNSNKITSLSLTGDFFVHPEESIEKIEKLCIGEELPIQDSLTHDIQMLLKNDQIELIGISAADIVALLQEATQ